MVRRGNLQGALSFLVLFSISNAAARTASPKADDWPSLRPAELTDRGGAESQGEHAILLYREDRTDDAARVETHHYRIKILTQAGRKYATIEIPHAKRYLRVQAIRARTIHPDGSATPFTGEIFDKLVVKAKRVLVQVKTFTLPDVQPGTIIEYRYRATWDESRFNQPEWELQNE